MSYPLRPIKPNVLPRDDADQPRSLGYLYTLAMPLLASVATVRGVTVAGFNYTGFLWVFALGLGGLLIVSEHALHPERRMHLPVAGWLLWCSFMGLSLFWLDDLAYDQIQDVLQISMPLVVGMVASLFIRTRQHLSELVRAFYWSLPILAALIVAALLGFQSYSAADEAGVETRAASYTAVLIGAVFLTDSRLTSRGRWLGWFACLALAAASGSRMATIALLMLPIANPLTTHWLRKAGTLLAIGCLGYALYLTPTFQERFFPAETGGEFDSAGRFEAWPFVFEDALNRPWIGHGIGSVQVLVPQIWPTASPHIHNDYLRIFYELGIVGLTMFVCVAGWQVISLFRWLRRTDGVVQHAFAASWLALVMFLMVACSDNPIIYNLPYVNPMFALMGAAYTVACADSARAGIRAHRHAQPAPASPGIAWLDPRPQGGTP